MYQLVAFLDGPEAFLITLIFLMFIDFDKIFKDSTN